MVSDPQNQVFFLSFPEMEFLDINLIKDSSRLLNAIHTPFCWRILLFSGFKNTGTSRNQENSILFMSSIL
jgi:hypothetical protein